MSLQFLVTEILKVKNGTSIELIDTSFCLSIKTAIYQITVLLLRKRNRRVSYGTESLSSLAPKILKSIPQSLEDKTEPSQLKINIKKWITTKCSCRLGKNG